MCLCELQIFDTRYPSSSQLPHCYCSDLVELFHLPRRVIPDSSAEAPSELEGVLDSNRVFEADLAVNYTPNKPRDMVEDKVLVLLEGELVLLVLFAIWKVNAA